MIWRTGYCFIPTDLYDNFNATALKVKRKLVSKKYSCVSKQEFCGKVLAYCLYLIILDMIENNITFMFPTVGKEARFQVKPFTGEQFQKMYSKGKFAGIDFLSSNFTGYELCFRYQAPGGFKEKPMYISKNMKDKFYENINNGKVYY